MIEVENHSPHFGQLLVVGTPILRPYYPEARYGNVVIPLLGANVDDGLEELYDVIPACSFKSLMSTLIEPNYDSYDKFGDHPRKRCAVCPAKVELGGKKAGLEIGGCICKCTGALLEGELILMADHRFGLGRYKPKPFTVALLGLTETRIGELAKLSIKPPRYDDAPPPIPNCHTNNYIFECGANLSLSQRAVFDYYDWPHGHSSF